MARIVWLAQLDADVEQLQEDMSEVQADIEDLRAGQLEILILLRELTNDTRHLRGDFENHTHGEDGEARVHPP